MTTLTPYLMFNGTCPEALALYTRALRGAIDEMSRYADAPPNPDAPPLSEAQQQWVMHARLQAGGIELMASDSQPHAPVSTGSHLTLSLSFDSKDAQRRAFDILSEGAKVTMPLADTFWGAHFGMLDDRFGVSWMFNYDYPKP